MPADVREELVRLEDGGLAVLFRKVGDRWSDAILRPGGDTELIRSFLLTSGEGDRARVGNPVYQEVQLHGPTDGPPLCLLMTGLSHDHHFSAAVTLASGRLEFDVADRCRSPVESLAATYVLDLDSGALESADPSRIAWTIDGPGAGRLELVAGPDATLTLAEAGRKATRVQIVATIHPGTFTHRLRYGWRWTTADPLTR